MSDDSIKVAAVVPVTLDTFIPPPPRIAALIGQYQSDRGLIDAIFECVTTEHLVDGPVTYLTGRKSDIRELKHDRCDECGTRIHEVLEGHYPERYSWVHDATGVAECAITPVASPMRECYDCGHGLGWDDDGD